MLSSQLSHILTAPASSPNAGNRGNARSALREANRCSHGQCQLYRVAQVRRGPILHLMTAGPLLLPDTAARSEGRSLSPLPTPLHDKRAAGPAQPCAHCPPHQQGLSYCDAQAVVWGRASPVQSLDSDMGPGSSPVTIGVTWAMDTDTDPCCCMATHPDTALRSSTGQDFTMASGGFTGYSSPPAHLLICLSS